MKTLSKVLVIAALFALTAVPAFADILTPTQDTYIGPGFANKGAESVLYMCTDHSQYGYARSLLQFDVSSYTNASLIDSAILTLTFSSAPSEDNSVINVYRTTKAWNDTATNSAAIGPFTSWWSVTGGDYVGTDGVAVSTPGYGYPSSYPAAYATTTVGTSNAADTSVNIDITNLVKDWVNGADNFGLGLIVQDGWGSWNFYSSEGTYSPQLTVSTVPEPSTLVLFVSLLAGLSIYVWRKK